MFFIGFRTGFLRLATLCLVLLSVQACIKDLMVPPKGDSIEPPKETSIKEGIDYFLLKIDLGSWKVPLSIGNPREISPPEILDYANNDVVRPFMYNDSTDGALVFYTYLGASTANSAYSRTELREQIKAANCLSTHDEGAFAKVKDYELEVSHWKHLFLI